MFYFYKVLKGQYSCAGFVWAYSKRSKLKKRIRNSNFKITISSGKRGGGKGDEAELCVDGVLFPELRSGAGGCGVLLFDLLQVFLHA